ncbi:MAG: GDSL-type esterase/lipase family protein [Solirubrobacteraceae bacterium]
MTRILITALVLFAAGAQPAAAQIWLAADTTRDRGHIELLTLAEPDIERVYLAEETPDGPQAIGDFALAPAYDDPTYGPLVGHALPRATRWRCDLLERGFVAVGVRADGSFETSRFDVRTPSCRDRLELSVPRRVKPGAAVAVTVRDSWQTGLTSASVCFARRACRTLGFADGQAEAATTFRAGAAGLARVVLRAPGQQTSAPVAVGVRPPAPESAGPTVLTTGDSMMQSLDAILGDRLAGVANARSDVHAGTGLTTRPDAWLNWARGQVASHRPDATVVFLGTNDVYAMQAAGRAVQCCGRKWVAEYARRARTVMRTYAQGGEATVLWLALPTMSDPRRGPSTRAVNRALKTAAADVPTAHILRTDEIFTPDGRFRASMRYDGRVVRVRAADGVHLSVAGARIAASAITGFLSRAGILG